MKTLKQICSQREATHPQPDYPVHQAARDHYHENELAQFIRHFSYFHIEHKHNLRHDSTC